MNITVQTKIKRKIYDAATGELLKASPWEKNLVMDLGLNNLARGPGTPTSPANSFTNMIVGSGTNPVKVASGAVTFTQAGTTLTASAGFFNAGMVGTLFKYGTGSGGAEYYITGYSDTQNVTVDTSATVGTPTLGTVWYVNQTALQTYAHASTSYRTNAGDNFTAFSLGQVTMQRTLIIASQGTNYTVNEIGWNGNTVGSSTNTINGRIVLGSSDLVTPAQYYLVTIQLIFTYTPASPTAVLNTGTVINTAGTAMTEHLDIQTVQSDGSVGGGGRPIDGSGQSVICSATTVYSQFSTPSSSADVAFTTTIVGFQTAANWAYAGSRGKMTLTHNFSCTTTGQSLVGVGFNRFGNSNGSAFDVLFTAPYTTPVGLFAGTFVWSEIYNRVLSN